MKSVRRAPSLFLAGAGLASLAIATSLSVPDAPASATGGNSIASPDTQDDAGQYTSLALDASGNPIVSYYDQTNGDLKVLHCNDPNCAGGDESITAVDTNGNVGQYTSLVLDASGNPVVSYYNAFSPGDLKLVHCNDPDCAGGDESVSIADLMDNVGLHTSLELDAAGNPVVSYRDQTNQDLKVLHCNDPNCLGADESIESPVTAGFPGYFTSSELDASGDPVISYYDSGAGRLKILHCNDASCSEGIQSTNETPDTTGSDVLGLYTSLALDASGNPVVSYYDQTNGDLKVLHCNDPDCAGGDESITNPATFGDVGLYTSLALDASGKPVVSYYIDTTFFDDDNVGIMHCNDPNCAGGDESFTGPDSEGSVGQYTSLVLDGSGNPVVSYYDETNGDLKVLHCGDPNCTAGKPPLAGDVNCDNVVDAVDALLVLQLTAGLVPSLPCQAAGDVNSDGMADALDALLVLQFVAGLIGSL